LIDSLTAVQQIQDRVHFHHSLTNLLAQNPSLPFKLPASHIFHNAPETQATDILEHVKLPCILKRREGTLLQYAHYFIVCHTPSALTEALSFEGFRD
jgi:hypothetical protein